MSNKKPTMSYDAEQFKFSVDSLADYAQKREQKSYNQKFVKYGKDNLYPNFITSLLERSPIHKSIIDRKIQLTIGSSIEITGLSDKFMEFNPNFIESIKKSIIDYLILGYFAVKCTPNRAGSILSSLSHLDASYVRMGVKDEDDTIEKYFVSPNWANKTRPLIEEFNKFDPNNLSEETLFVYSSYLPTGTYYPLPSYAAAINDIITDGEISKFHLANLDNGFHPSVHIKVNKVFEDPELRVIEAQNLYENFKGSLRAGEAFITFNNPDEKGVEINPLDSNSSDEKFLSLYDKTIQSILSAHSVTSPLLFGIKTTGQLGGGNELVEAQELFMNSVVIPTRNIFSTVFQDLLTFAGETDVNIEFKDLTIVSNKFTEATLSKILTINEMRRLAGYDDLPSGNVLINQ